MLSFQHRHVRQRRRRKTMEWKEGLDCRLRFRDATVDMCRCLLNSMALSLAFFSPILALRISAVPDIVSRTTHLQFLEVISVLVASALQLSFLCGALGREPSLLYTFSWTPSDEIIVFAKKPSLTLPRRLAIFSVGPHQGLCPH
jgi:hypothetical protein